MGGRSGCGLHGPAAATGIGAGASGARRAGGALRLDSALASLDAGRRCDGGRPAATLALPRLRGRRGGAVRTTVGRPRAGAGSRRGGAGGHGLRAVRAAAAGSRRPGRERHRRRPARAAADLLERHRGAGGDRSRPLRPNGGRPTPKPGLRAAAAGGRRAARDRRVPELLARGARGAGGGVGRFAGARARGPCAGPRARRDPGARRGCRCTRGRPTRGARAGRRSRPGEGRGSRCSWRWRCLPLRRPCSRCVPRDPRTPGGRLALPRRAAVLAVIGRPAPGRRARRGRVGGPPGIEQPRLRRDRRPPRLRRLQPVSYWRVALGTFADHPVQGIGSGRIRGRLAPGA